METVTVTPTDIEQQAVDHPSPYARKHIHQYLESDGRDVDHPMADALILLYTTGRRTGKVRRTPLASFRDGEALIVIASKGGAPQHPHWYFNLVEDPTVWVRHKADFYEAEAEVLDGDEYAAMWGRITDWAPSFQDYQDKVERRLPLVRLTRA